MIFVRFLLFAAAVASDASVNDSEKIRAGLEAYARRDFDKTIELLEMVKDRSPDTLAALGFSHYFLNACDKAAPLLERLAAASPDNFDANYALGVCYARLRNAPAARAAFGRMFHFPADSAKSRLLAARFMIKEHVEDVARTELEHALAMEPGLPEAHYYLGLLAGFRGDFDESIRQLRAEISVNPAFSLAFYELGDAYNRKQMWDEAVEPLRKAIWLNPALSSPYVLLGKVYLKKNMHANAEAVLKHALDMDPNNSTAHWLLGTLYRDTGRDALAREEMGTVERLYRPEPQKR